MLCYVLKFKKYFKSRPRPCPPPPGRRCHSHHMYHHAPFLNLLVLSSFSSSTTDDTFTLFGFHRRRGIKYPLLSSVSNSTDRFSYSDFLFFCKFFAKSECPLFYLLFYLLIMSSAIQSAMDRRNNLSPHSPALRHQTKSPIKQSNNNSEQNQKAILRLSSPAVQILNNVTQKIFR